METINHEDELLTKLRASQAAFIERSLFMQNQIEELTARIETLERIADNHDRLVE